MSIAEIAGLLGVIIATATVLGLIFTKVLPALRKWSRILDRIVGVPADPKNGQPKIPGIFEVLEHQNEVLETIRHEVEYNNGTSIKDSQRRQEADQRQVKSELSNLKEGVAELGRKFDEHIAPLAPVTTVNIMPGGQS